MITKLLTIYRATGSTTVNLVPSPTVLCTEMRPVGLLLIYTSPTIKVGEAWLY
jgi:hypothetical protein